MIDLICVFCVNVVLEHQRSWLLEILGVNLYKIGYSRLWIYVSTGHAPANPASARNCTRMNILAAKGHLPHVTEGTLLIIYGPACEEKVGCQLNLDCFSDNTSGKIWVRRAATSFRLR
jgi:hypothetical protein